MNAHALSKPHIRGLASVNDPPMEYSNPLHSSSVKRPQNSEYPSATVSYEHISCIA